MAVCPECWAQKPLLSERCANCNTVVDPVDTIKITFALFLFRVLGFVALVWFVLALLSGLSG